MKQFDLSTNEGVQKAEELRMKLYDALMAKTPRERYDWLVARDWKRVSKDMVPNSVEKYHAVIDGDVRLVGAQERKGFVRIKWEIPEYRFKAKNYVFRVVSQTDAILMQLWWNMEEMGLFKQSKEGHRILPNLT